MIIDTHAHLDFPEYDSDLFEVLQNAKNIGVESIINVGVDLKSSQKAFELINKVKKEYGLPGIFASIGIHPNKASATNDNDFDELKSLLNKDKVVAIGETGLDYYRDHSSPSDQGQLFRKHIELALKHNLPIIIHNREASDDCLEIVHDYSNSGLKGVVHCFSANNEYAQKFLELGFYISFAGTVTFPGAKNLRNTLKYVPIDRLLLETDSPFLAPQPKRGQRNEPSFLQYVIPLLAENYKLSNNDIERITTFNAKNLFTIGKQTDKGEIAYVIRNSLYLNITNKCTNKCSFCMRDTYPYVKGHYLKLEKEPSIEELLDAIGDPSGYDEVVFCGFAEPTERLDALITIATFLKKRGVCVRLDTNGLGDLINGRPICSELEGLIDHICISLNSNRKDQYVEICKPRFGEKSYPALLSFIKDAKKFIPNVLVSVVSVPEVDVEECRKIANDLGVSFRVRKYNDTG